MTNRRHVLCAVSGGADSVAMLRMLRDRDDLQITVAHFEHGIRGHDSIADAQFVVALCDKLNMPLIMGGGDVPAIAKAQGIGIEQAARAARHAFLREAMVQSGACCIALAHHQQDQAETVLMHIARGAGLRGASGMGAHDGVLWRPLIHMTRAQILAYLNEINQEYREDATNLILDNPRNALRHRVMPELEQIYPAAQQAICRFSDIARADDEYIDGQAALQWKRLARKLPNGYAIAFDESLPTALRRRLIARATAGCELDTNLRVCALYGAERGQIDIGGGIVASKGNSHLYLCDSRIMPPQGVVLTDGARLSAIGYIKLIECEPEIKDLGACAQIMDADAIEGATLRCRQVGDKFQMMGARGARLLSDVLTDKKIDRPLRDFMPLIAIGKTVLWMPGIGVSECAKIKHTTARAVRADWIDNEGEDDYYA